MEGGPVRIVVADDHPIFRHGLRTVLEAEPDLAVVGEASENAEAVRVTRALRPDVVLLGLAVSRMEALTELAAVPTRTILLAAAIDQAEVVTALQRGAAGVVLKASAGELLVKAIRSVMAGQCWIERGSVSDLVDALRGSVGRGARDRFGVTPREREIASAVVAGFSNKEIAARFGLSADTVKRHLTNVFSKVGASNRLELALFAVHQRWLADEETAARPGSAAPRSRSSR